jgi:hypothetical protein
MAEKPEDERKDVLASAHRAYPVHPVDFLF